VLCVAELAKLDDRVHRRPRLLKRSAELVVLFLDEGLEQLPEPAARGLKSLLGEEGANEGLEEVALEAGVGAEAMDDGAVRAEARGERVRDGQRGEGGFALELVD